MKKVWNIYQSLELKKDEFVQIALVLITLLTSCFLFTYGDCKAYTQWSINIWDALATGRINEYFLVTAENLRKAYPLGNSYGVLYLLPWAIWNLPIWVTHFFNGNLNVDTPLCLFWSQIFLFICAIITSIYTAKIVYKFTKDKTFAKNAFIFTIGAGSLLVSVGYSGQDEIVYIACLMAGIYYYISEKRKTGLLLCGVSVTLCNMMLLPVLAFIMFYEKNVIKLGCYVLLCLLPEIIVSRLCGSAQIDYLINSDLYGMAGQYTFEIYSDWFFGRTIRYFGIGNVSLFVMIVVIIYIIAYMKNDDCKDHLNFTALAYLTIIMSLVLCIFAWEHAYRYYISVPLLVCTVFVAGHKKADISAGMFLITLYELFRTYIACENDYILRFDACALNNWVEYHATTGTVFTLFSQYYPQVGLLTIPMNSCFLGIGICIIGYIFFEKRESIQIKFPQMLIKCAYCLLPLTIIVIYIFCYCNFI